MSRWSGWGKNKGQENKGLENKGLENEGLENKGQENKGLENEGLENEGLENEGFRTIKELKTESLPSSIGSRDELSTNWLDIELEWYA